MVGRELVNVFNDMKEICCLALRCSLCSILQCFKEWKKTNIVPVHKKNDKQLIRNYRPVSLLPVCGKIFEKIKFNSQFKYLVIF